MVKKRELVAKQAEVVKGKIQILFVELAKPIVKCEYNEGVTLGEFLKRRDVDYSPSIRVNRQVASQDYVLKSGDVVSKMSKVAGGR